MPFLAAAVPAIAGGVASTAAGAGIAALTKGAQQSAQAANAPQSVNLANPLQTAGGTLDQQQQLINALGQSGATQQQASNLQQQQALAGQLGQLAQGNGPNPALAQLAQTTGQNVQQQAALQAGQRGAGANVGLIGRNAGEAGVNAQQGAVGQAATLRAQQQLAGINALQQQQGLQAQTAGNLIGQQQQGLQGLSGQQLGAQQSYNQQLLNQQQGINSINAGYGQQNAQQQAGMIGQLGTGVQSGISTGLQAGIAGAMKPEEKKQVDPIRGNTMQDYQNLPNYAEGGTVNPAIRKSAISGVRGAMAEGGPVFANSSNQSAGMKENYKGKSSIGQHLMMAKGGKVPAMVSPGEIYLTRSQTKKVVEGKASPSSVGERIKGKAEVPGNSLANDKVKKNLEVGGTVVPRSDSGDDDKAARFVKAVVSRKGKK